MITFLLGCIVVWMFFPVIAFVFVGIFVLIGEIFDKKLSEEEIIRIEKKRDEINKKQDEKLDDDSYGEYAPFLWE